MYRSVLITMVSLIILSGCAVFKNYSNDRLSEPKFDETELQKFSIVILEQQTDISLSVGQIDYLIGSLQEEPFVSNVYYNETPDENVFYEELLQGVTPVVFSIEYTHQGIESAAPCVYVNTLFLGLMPISCRWRNNYTIAASVYDENTESMKEYYNLDRRIDFSGWPNLYGILLYPFSLERNGFENSLKKDILIALNASRN